MISAAVQGRDLAITVEGSETFVVAPLPGRQGEHLTNLYLLTMTRELPAATMNDVLDGGVWVMDGEPLERWVEGADLKPKPEAERHVLNQMRDSISQTEQQDVLHAAFFWQTVLGLDGVQAYIQAGGGLAAGVKTLRFLVSTLGVSPLTMLPPSESETLTPSQESSPSTGTRSGSGMLAKLPAGKRSRRAKKPR
jgi:hypothetical protein